MSREAGAARRTSDEERRTGLALRELAEMTGYHEGRCPECRPRKESRGCANCGGSGRIWLNGHSSLSDAGLERLRGLHRDPALDG